MQPTTINKLEVLQTYYEGYIFDLWGVVHNGFEAYPGVLEYLKQLTALGKSIIFLSNAPRPAPILIQKLLSLGIIVTPEMVLTSGDMVREQLKHFNDEIFKTLGRRFYHLGADRNSDILAGISADVVNNLEEANFILLTAYMDVGEDLNQYDNLLKSAVSLNLPAICANPDKEIINGDKLRYCAGFLAEKIEKMGGTVHYYGKPYRAIYEEAFKRFHTKGIVEKNRILMIGDTLETDILGAKNACVDSALVLTGNMSILLANQAIENMPTIECTKFLSALFKQYAVNPRWIIPSFNLRK